MSNHTPIDVNDVLTVEPSQRPEFWDLVVWDIDGNPTIVCTERRKVIDERLEVLHSTLATYDDFCRG